MARVKALPQDYQIVYKEIQNYLFKVGPVGLTGMLGRAGSEASDQTEGTGLLSGIIDLFEEGAALGKGVLEVTGRDGPSWPAGTRVNVLLEVANGNVRYLLKATDQLIEVVW